VAACPVRFDSLFKDAVSYQEMNGLLQR